jgi:hypothetical protein
MQIGGVVALAIGTARAAKHRRRAHLAVVPNGTGVSVLGRF